MSAIILPLVLLGAAICWALGIARLFGWAIAQRDAAFARVFREKQFVAIASAGVRRD